MARAFTGTTPAAPTDTLNPDQDRYHDTNPDAAAIIGDLTEPARASPNAYLAPSHRATGNGRRPSTHAFEPNT